MYKLKELLETEAAKRDRYDEVSEEKLDPVIVAREYHDEFIALVCALFAYGNVTSIVKFLRSLDFSLLDANEDDIKDGLEHHYYRFQNSEDIIALFTALSRIKKADSLNDIFLRGYKNGGVIEGVNMLTDTLNKAYTRDSRGYMFLISKRVTRPKGSGALKRWMMYLRWMVRRDAIDMGLWNGVSKSDLIIPLDTHTFHVSQRVGLLQRKTYDLQAAIELTETLRTFDPDDPLKYDFALYRLGQENLV